MSDQNISDRVANELREAIHGGRLAPGTRLVERKLAAELGVSHIPIREALARLADEGLVERMPRRGSRVAALTQRDLDELSSVRVLLEQAVVARVQERWSRRAETELRRVVDTMVRAARRGDADKLFDLDLRFHEKLGLLSDHHLLIELATQLRGRINGFLRAASSSLEPYALEQHARAHGELVDAIASGDRAVAAEAIAEHITAAADRIRPAFLPGEETR